MTVPYLHLYEAYAVASDGKTTIRIPLTTEQHVRLLAESADITSRCVRWEWRDVKPSKDRPDATSGHLGKA